MKAGFVLLTLLSFVAGRSFELNNDIDGNPWKKFIMMHRKLEKFAEGRRDDIDLPPLDMIQREGYPAEAHVITTSDGYILTMHRIPGGPGSIPILLQHGLLGSSADWIIAGKAKGLAYLLADRGYDVWLGNARGNTYSRAHTTLSTSDSKFWDFSWDEMGRYDLPAVITYITNLKSSPLFYVGHSMGTTMFYVMATRRPDIADKVKAMISLAPVAYMSHVKSPIRIVAPFANDIEMIAHFIGADEFLPQNIFLKFLAQYGCDLDTFETRICENSIFVICGFDKEQFNNTLLPTILGHSPAGSSTKAFTHYAQEIVSGRFQAYDYGPSKNRRYYNDTSPPDYDPAEIRVPVALIVADNDWLASSKDVDILWQQLPNRIGKYRVDFRKFNHVDFLWGIDAPKLVYERIFNIIEQFHDKTIDENQSSEQRK